MPKHHAILIFAVASCADRSGGGPDAVPVVDPVRPAAIYDTSRIELVAQMTYAGRTVELYVNRAYPCGRPDPDGTLGYHELLVMHPAAAPAAPVAYVKLTGGAVGWIDVRGDYGPAGAYHGPEYIATAAWNRERLVDFGSDLGNSLFARVRDAHPEWTMLIPSLCSHDIYNGMGPGVFGAGEDFPRYGWLALASAVKFVHETADVTEIFAEGTSAGGGGVYFLSRDLAAAVPGVAVRGVVMDSQPHIPAAFAALFDGSTACHVDFEPVAVAFVHIGLTTSVVDDLRAGLIDTPFYHVWNRRDWQFCQDEPYSDANLHGALARAIRDVNPGGRSVNRRVCVADPGKPLPCGRHGVVGGVGAPTPGAPFGQRLEAAGVDEEAAGLGRDPDVGRAAFDWIEGLATRWDQVATTPGES